ncbi:MAG: FMN-binding glutamate synthase family protein [bacterium]
MEMVFTLLKEGVAIIGAILVLLFIIALCAFVILYMIDKGQRRDAIRHNYPVVGRFRYLFIWLGEFFRQYFFAMDREELPFNRAERDWIAKATHKKNVVQPFGSTRIINKPGTPIFTPAAFPLLDEEAYRAPAVIFGEGHVAQPYAVHSLINISAMSYGALSKPAILALSRGAAAAGCYMNSGEGGISPWHLQGGGDLIFQLGTAKYGARDLEGNFSETIFRQTAEHDHIKMIELKLSQGAKPGKGGILPAIKVTEEIAQIRGIEAGKSSISPNRHKEVNNFDDLLDFVAKLRELSGKPVGIKTVLGRLDWIDGLCGVIKLRGEAAAPDFITLDGGDGGTGAAPLALIDNVGLTLRESLPMLINSLEKHGLRKRIKVICAGKLVTPAEVAWAYASGADVVNTARGFMFSLGCIQAMRCHSNNCPTGITTHKKNLQSGLNPKRKAIRVQNYIHQMEKDVNVIAHSCGVPHARALQRHHVRVVQANGRSKSLETIIQQS